MPNNPERPLAPHVRAAIAVGQGVMQARMGEEVRGPNMPSQVQAAIPAAQPKTSKATSGLRLAAHVRKALAGSLEVNVQEPAGGKSQAAPNMLWVRAAQDKALAEPEGGTARTVAAPTYRTWDVQATIQPMKQEKKKATGVSYASGVQCVICGRSKSEHKVDETNETKKVALEILQALRKEKSEKRYMIGVLKGGGAFFATKSGLKRFGKFESAVAAVNKKLKIKIQVIKSIKDKHITSRGGALIDPEYIQNCKRPDGGYPLACAAPKLFYAAGKAGKKLPWYMSEISYDPKKVQTLYVHGDTAKSCGTCESLLPMLICGNAISLEDLFELNRLAEHASTGKPLSLYRSIKYGH